MCGIVGIVNFKNDNIDSVLLRKMNDVLYHRGPEDEGYVFIQQNTGQHISCSGHCSPAEVKAEYIAISDVQEKFSYNIGLAHRRFSIIDLSAGGHQPFFDSFKKCCVVFNGEIYNYIEVRNELKDMGHIFRSSSDTEVIVEAYKAWGTECFRHFNGMWALALYDFNRKIIIISRDRLGKKPLYWARKNDTIYFASEIKALFEIPEIAREKKINEKAIYLWIANCFRDLDNTTFFDGIYTLPAASWTVIDRDFPNNMHNYWQVPQRRLRENDISIWEATSAVRETLEAAVRIRMRADVPWCVELSGGMDSSALVAFASQSQGKKMVTYTVRFPEKEWNEEPYARSIAKHFNTDYRVIDSPMEKFWYEILPFTYLEEEPYHSPNLHTNQVIRRMMRADGIKMYLNGAAGDELFAGYNYQFEQVQIENLLAGRVGQYVNNGINYSESTSAFKTILSPLVSLVKYMLKESLSSFGIRRKRHTYINTDVPFTIYEHIATKALYNDVTNEKIPYWLRSGDKAQMGVPIEGRAPFLDYRMVELALTLPVTYLIRNGWHKWILRKAMENLMPKDVVWRKKKMGFPFPYDRFYSENKKLIELIFREANNPYINFSSISKLYVDQYQYWRLISFVLWYELFINENTDLFKHIQQMNESINQPTIYGYTPEFLKSRQPSTI